MIYRSIIYWHKNPEACWDKEAVWKIQTQALAAVGGCFNLDVHSWWASDFHLYCWAHYHTSLRHRASTEVERRIMSLCNVKARLHMIISAVNAGCWWSSERTDKLVCSTSALCSSLSPASLALSLSIPLNLSPIEVTPMSSPILSFHSLFPSSLSLSFSALTPKWVCLWTQIIFLWRG